MHTITVSMGSTVGLRLLLPGFSFRYVLIFNFIANNFDAEDLRLTLYFLVERCSGQCVGLQC